VFTAYKPSAMIPRAGKGDFHIDVMRIRVAFVPRRCGRTPCIWRVQEMHRTFGCHRLACRRSAYVCGVESADSAAA
jgi:hypothetical protein